MSVLINFDGMAGSGKTKIVHMLANLLQKNGRRVKVIREKHIPSFQNKLKEWKIKSSFNHYSVEDIRRIAKERANAHKLFILPMLQSGTIVLLDRCYFTCAALRATKEIPSKLIIDTNLNENVIKGEKSFILICPIEISKKRIMDRENGQRLKWPEKFPNIHEYLSTTHVNYKSIVNSLNDDDIIEINASLSIQEVFHEITLKTGFF